MTKQTHQGSPPQFWLMGNPGNILAIIACLHREPQPKAESWYRTWHRLLAWGPCKLVRRLAPKGKVILVNLKWLLAIHFWVQRKFATSEPAKHPRASPVVRREGDMCPTVRSCSLSSRTSGVTDLSCLQRSRNHNEKLVGMPGDSHLTGRNFYLHYQVHNSIPLNRH